MPIVAAHFYIGDGTPEEVKNIPTDWYYTRFDDVDILYVGPLVCRQTDHIFSLQHINSDNVSVDYSARFDWVIKRARYENPRIKIIASQWWGSSNVLADLKASPTEKIESAVTTARIETYTDSVRDFLASWQSKTYVYNGTPISLRVDGYDVDYEDGNTVDIASTVFERIRRKVDQYAETNHVPKYLLTLTPAKSIYVENINPFVDYINMQNYDGGIWTPPEEYVNAIDPTPPSKLIWGLEAEQTFKNYPKVWTKQTNTPQAKLNEYYSIQDQLDAISRLKLGGIFVWRLTLDNWVYENAVQLYLYNKLHPETPKPAPAGLEASVIAGYERGGRGADGNLASPFTPAEWEAANPGLKPPPSV